MSVIINDREYEWGDLTLIIGGKDIVGFRGIKYSEKAEREAIYAKGRKPQKIQTGNVGYEGEMKMLQSEYEKLVKAGKGTVLSLRLDALMCYGNPSTGDAMITDRIETLAFTEAAKEFNQGDKFAEITLPFICLDIKNQA